MNILNFFLSFQDGLVSRLDSVYGQYLPSVDQEEQVLDPAQFSEQEHHLNINVSHCCFDHSFLMYRDDI